MQIYIVSIVDMRNSQEVVCGFSCEIRARSFAKFLQDTFSHLQSTYWALNRKQPDWEESSGFKEDVQHFTDVISLTKKVEFQWVWRNIVLDFNSIEVKELEVVDFK